MGVVAKLASSSHTSSGSKHFSLSLHAEGLLWLWFELRGTHDPLFVLLLSVFQEFNVFGRHPLGFAAGSELFQVLGGVAEWLLLACNVVRINLKSLVTYLQRTWCMLSRVAALVRQSKGPAFWVS